MAEVELTLPTVQFGNVKVRATPEEMGLESIADSHALGVATAVYLNLFQQGFKVGSQVDVTAPSGASQESEVSQAQELLDKGLGGVTEVPEEVVTHVDTGLDYPAAAPWTEPAVDVKPKPWETGTSTPDKAVAALGGGW
jgi:hypothetical protein